MLNGKRSNENAGDGVLFSTATDMRIYTKKRLHHRCFSVKFVEF